VKALYFFLSTADRTPNGVHIPGITFAQFWELIVRCSLVAFEKYDDVDEINKVLKISKNKNKNKKEIRLLFSAHGLPEKIIKKGDPYQNQVEKTVSKVLASLNKDEFLYTICYQSKVGPLKWIGPSTEEEIIKASKKNEVIILIPIAFVSEHSETLVELDIEYKEAALNNGCELYLRTPALGKNDFFIKSLANLVLQNNKNKILNNKVCSKDYNKCFYNTFWEKV
jgi:ferrochelatase